VAGEVDDVVVAHRSISPKRARVACSRSMTLTSTSNSPWCPPARGVRGLPPRCWRDRASDWPPSGCAPCCLPGPVTPHARHDARRHQAAQRVAQRERFAGGEELHGRFRMVSSTSRRTASAPRFRGTSLHGADEGLVEASARRCTRSAPAPASAPSSGSTGTALGRGEEFPFRGGVHGGIALPGDGRASSWIDTRNSSGSPARAGAGDSARWRHGSPAQDFPSLPIATAIM